MKNILKIFYCFLFFTIGCTSDIMMTDASKVTVIVDSYIQSEQIEELDVLIVLDTSGSMNDNYSDVADGMDILRSDIESLTLDYRFAYITMDPTNISYTGYYDSNSSPIDMLMAPNLLPMTSLEEGFASTYAFITSEEGNDFRRPNADFLLFLISDEDEQSAINSQLFYDWLHEEFVNVNHDVVCIANPSNDNSWGSDIGYKYIELSYIYGKDMIDIKDEDWSVWLSESSYLIQKKSSIKLTHSNPIASSIVVYINNIVSDSWSYIQDTNTVQLDVVPEYGAIVEVGYNVYM